MKIILSFTLIIASFNAGAQMQAGSFAASGAISGMRALQNDLQERTCNFLIQEFEKDPANRVPAPLIVDRMRSALGLNISPAKGLDMEQWLTAQRFGGGIRPMHSQLENSCRARSSTWFGSDTEDVINLAGAEAGMALVNEALHTNMLEQTNQSSLPLVLSGDQSCSLPDEVICEVESPVSVPGDITSLNNALNRFIASTSVASTSGPCSCLRDKINRRLPDAAARERALTEARNSLNNIIVREAGKKFMDSLASNFEDVNFYKNLPDKREKFSPLYCTNVQTFEEGLGDSCNVPQSVKQERLHLVFNSLGGLSDSATLSGHMEAFTQRISNMTPPGHATPYTRDQLDIRRWSLSNDSPNFNGIDTAMARMFSIPAIRDRLRSDIEGNEYRTPEQAILKVLIEDIQSANALPSYINLAHFEPEKRTEILEALASGDKNALGLVLYNHISYAMQMHPGIARLLSDRDTFNRLKTSLPRDFYTLKGFVESQSDLMAQDFQAECEQLKIKLSQLICTPQEDLIKNISQRELANLIRTYSPDEASSLREMNNLLMCENPNAGSLMAFNNLRPVENYTPAKNSDYFARVNPELQGQSTFDLLFLAEQNNENVRTEITNAVIRTEGHNRGWADQVANRYHGDRGGRISDETIAQVRRETSQSGSTALAQNTDTQVTNQIASTTNETEADSETSEAVTVPNVRVPENTVNQALVQNNYVNVPATQTNVASEEISNEERIAAYQRRFSEEEEERLRNNLTPDQLTEIDRLREEAKKDRAKLDELTNNAQLARIRQLEEQVRLLEARKEASTRDVSPIAENSDTTSFERSESSGPQNVVSNSAAALSSQVEALTSAQRSQGVGSAATSGSAGGGNISRSIASVQNPPAAVIPRLGSPLPGALVITSMTTRTGDVPPAELSQEVIRYLTQNNPDLAVLTQIKENGMLYKFRTVENGVEKEREVFIKFDLLTPEARREVEKQIAKKRAENTDLSDIQNELTAARRSYSYEALKLIVGQEIIRQR